MLASTFVIVSVDVVAPETQDAKQPPALFARIDQETPALIDTCHWKDVAPVNDGVNVAVVPAQALRDAMSVLRIGAALMVTLAVEITEQVPSASVTCSPTLPDAPAV